MTEALRRAAGCAALTAAPAFVAADVAVVLTRAASFEKCPDIATALPATGACASLHLARVCAKQDGPDDAAMRLDEAERIDRRHDVLSQEECDEIEQLLSICRGSP